jgi:hypothetical protein
MNIWWPHERLIIDTTGGIFSLDESRLESEGYVWIMFTHMSGDEIPVTAAHPYEADLIISTIAHAMSNEAVFLIMNTKAGQEDEDGVVLELEVDND